jgi:hypothetical protein
MSGRKNTLRQFQNITNANMSGTITSPVTSIQWLDNIGIQLIFSGSPVGSFSVQVSASYSQDLEGNVTNTGTWSPVLLTYWNGSTAVQGLSIPTSVGSPIYVDLNQLSSPWIQVVYTPVSGTGTLNAFITAKEI